MAGLAGELVSQVVEASGSRPTGADGALGEWVARLDGGRGQEKGGGDSCVLAVSPSKGLRLSIRFSSMSESDDSGTRASWVDTSDDARTLESLADREMHSNRVLK